MPLTASIAVTHVPYTSIATNCPAVSTRAQRITVRAMATGTDQRCIVPRSAGRNAAGASARACSVIAECDIRPGTPRSARPTA